jgi:hypothetical protein
MTGDRTLDLLAGLPLEDGHSWGSRAADFQLADARALLAEDGPRKHYLTRPRNGSKTTDLALMSVGLSLRMPPRSRCYFAAADQAQAALGLDAMAGFIERAGGLRRLFKVTGTQITVVRTGTTIAALASDLDSSWGLKPDLVAVDEFAAWADTPRTRRFWESLSSSAAKRPGARLIILTTPGSPSHFAFRVLERARSSRLWRVAETKGPSPWTAADELEDQRAQLPPSTFARLWVPAEWVEDEDRIANLEDLRACVSLHDWPLEPVPRRTYAIGVDVGVYYDATAVSICHLERSDDGPDRVVLDRMGYWPGGRGERQVRLSEVGDWVLWASQTYNGARVIFDESQAIEMRQRLQGKGVQAERFTFSQGSVGRLAAVLHQLIRDHRLALPDDPELLDELVHVRLRETAPGVYRMDHDPHRHDDRAVALALAAQHLVEGGSREVPAIATVNIGETSTGLSVGGFGDRAFEFGAGSEWDMGEPIADEFRARKLALDRPPGGE